jgi:hypothetical protein
MKGIPVNAYLIETGEFRWIPASTACANKEKAKEILEVLQKIPEDRRAVWASRLDKEQAEMTCPIIRKEADLCKEFDEFCNAYNKPKPKVDDQKDKGGELQNE